MAVVDGLWLHFLPGTRRDGSLEGIQQTMKTNLIIDNILINKSIGFLLIIERFMRLMNMNNSPFSQVSSIQLLTRVPFLVKVLDRNVDRMRSGRRNVRHFDLTRGRMLVRRSIDYLKKVRGQLGFPEAFCYSQNPIRVPRKFSLVLDVTSHYPEMRFRD